MSNQQRILKALDDAIEKLESAEREKFEQIAIVGMQGRFPGADSCDEYWELLNSGRDGLKDVPAERWSLDEWYDADPNASEKIVTKRGGWLNGVDQFDAHFFGISPKEASRLDPQQRLLLEVGWHALEQAGIRPSSLKNSQTGVFIGVTTNDYARLLESADEPLDPFFGTGNTLNAVAGRLAYLLGLQGPTLAVDTACSSSLVAVHLACAALRRGECDTALAGGVNVILSPEVTAAISSANMLAPDGRCKTFDESADGYVRSEGCGVVVLKRLSDAQSANDHVLAVVRGSAVNHDGASSGFTVPNGPAQQTLMRQALASAKANPADVSYIEAHGTGTSLGDPIEVGALAQVYLDGVDRRGDRPLLIGSAKTNIGHAESAAGIAGLIKVVLSLRAEIIPAHLNVENPSSRIPWDRLPLKIVQEPTEWVASEKPRLAGISSFGMSGTNAHVLVGDVEGAESDKWQVESNKGVDLASKLPATSNLSLQTSHLLVLSAKTTAGLRAQVEQYVGFLQKTDRSFADVCFSAATGREHFYQRLAVVGESKGEVCKTLSEWLETGEVAGGLVCGTAPESRRLDQADRPSHSQNGKGRSHTLLNLAGWFVQGGQIDWGEIFTGERRVALPLYRFQRQRYWVDGSERTIDTGNAEAERSPRVQGLDLGEEDERAKIFEALSPNLTMAEQALLPKLLMMLNEHHQGSNKEERDDLYQLAWRAKALDGWQVPPEFMPKVEQMAVQLEGYMSAVDSRTDVKEYMEKLEQLDGIAVGYILLAFAEMGWQWTLGKRFSTADFMQKNRVQPGFERLTHHLFKILSDEGVLKPPSPLSNHDGEWVVIASPPLASEKLEALQQVSLASSIEGEILTRCGSRLAAVLQGEQDPLQLLFPAGDRRSAANLYERAFGATVLNKLLARGVESALAQMPVGRTLRVLEIGGGTGGSTSSILPLLPEGRTEYCFTDVSTAFTSQAKEKFKDFGFIDYRRLDISRSPSEQGFQRDHFDLIIAANVLHATPDLPKSLRHVHELLAPHGLLLSLEGSAQMHWVDLIFGLTDGWWHFDDTAREDHPLISAERWEQVLVENRFESAASLAQSSGIFSRQGVMLGKKGGAVADLSSDKHWLILAGRTSKTYLSFEARAVASKLQRMGRTITIVDLSTSNWPVIFDDLERDLGATKILEGVVAFWPSDSQSPQKLCETVLNFVKGLADRPAWVPKLVWVTQGVLKPTNWAGLAQSLLWGIRRTLMLEHPEWRSTVIDLDGDLYDGAVDLQAVNRVTDLLLPELLNENEGGEDQVSWRCEGRFVPRLALVESETFEVESEKPEVKPIATDGTVLITGGLGGLGLLTAEWLADEGVERLALLGRSRPNAPTEAVINRLKGHGVAVEVYQADVTDRESLAAVLAKIGPSLKGVIHAAGALDDGILLNQTWSRFEKVLGAKMAGSWHLHELTNQLGLELDFFVLFSSTVGLFGGRGQGNHAAGGAFQDSLAHYRQSLGLSALSIDWGAWADVGAAAERDVKVSGATLISPKQGLAMLKKAMSLQSSGQDQVQVAAVPLLVNELPDRPVFAELRTVEAGAETLVQASVEEADDASLAQTLAGLPKRKRRNLIEAEIQDQLGRLLGVTGSEWWDGDAGFFDMGLDSLTAVDFRNGLQGRLGVPLPTTMAFDHPTLEALTGYLQEKVEEEVRGEILNAEDGEGAEGDIEELVGSMDEGRERTVENAEGAEVLGEAVDFEELDGVAGIEAELANLDEVELARLLDEELEAFN